MGSVVEHVEDKVIVGAVACSLLSLLLCIILWKLLRSGSVVVHSESAHLAGDIRQHVRINRSNEAVTSGSATPTADTERVTEINASLNQVCPVCIDSFRFSVQTNCSHMFCGQCFVTWWLHGRWTGPAKCPVCRQQVTILLQNFTDAETLDVSNDKRNLVEQINLYNRRFSGQPLKWHEYLRDLPTILRYCMSDFFSLGGLMWMFRVRIGVCIALALLYVASPLDIIPESVYGFFGLLDDFVILILIAIYVSIIYRRVVVTRAGAGPVRAYLAEDEPAEEELQAGAGRVEEELAHEHID